MTGNREYKSDVFSMLMEEPQNALELYNAVNGSAYTDSKFDLFCNDIGEYHKGAQYLWKEANHDTHTKICSIL